MLQNVLVHPVVINNNSSPISSALLNHCPSDILHVMMMEMQTMGTAVELGSALMIL